MHYKSIKVSDDALKIGRGKMKQKWNAFEYELITERKRGIKMGNTVGVVGMGEWGWENEDG